MYGEKFVCQICGVEFRSKLGNLRKHMKLKHNVIQMQPVKQNARCLETECEFTCATLKDLRNHLENEHGIKQEVEELLFRDIEEFNRWKLDEESRSLVNWIKGQHRVKNLRVNAQSTIYYYCKRSGRRRVLDDGLRVRRLKSQGSCKINALCTAALVLRASSEDIRVTYYKSHYGHENVAGHMKLPEDVKQMVANLLRKGLTAGQILKLSRSSPLTTSIRGQTITRCDVRNIAVEFSLCRFDNLKQLEQKCSSRPRHVLRIEREHQRAVTADMLIVKLLDAWRVLSDDIMYSIKKNKLLKDHLCKLRCPKCVCCVHSYVCTCAEYVGNTSMCSHIHRVALSEMETTALEDREEKMEDHGEEIMQDTNQRLEEVLGLMEAANDVGVDTSQLEAVSEERSGSDVEQLSEETTRVKEVQKDCEEVRANHKLLEREPTILNYQYSQADMSIPIGDMKHVSIDFSKSYVEELHKGASNEDKFGVMGFEGASEDSSQDMDSLFDEIEETVKQPRIRMCFGPVKIINRSWTVLSNRPG